MGIEVWTPALLSVTDVSRKQVGTGRKLKLTAQKTVAEHNSQIQK
jgi:hypothetical protein